MARAGQTLEEIRAFSELTRSCEGQSQAVFFQTEEAVTHARSAIHQFGGCGGDSQEESPLSLSTEDAKPWNDGTGLAEK
jgi:hypothetical protein